MENYTGKVLLIDDEEIVRMLLGDMLESLGYKVCEFADPVKAVDFYKENYNDIAFVFIDMVMPKLSGRETFFLLKNINREVKSIVLSGFSRNKDIDVMLEDGCLDFLKKPIKFETMKKTLNIILKDRCIDSVSSEIQLERIKENFEIGNDEIEEALLNMGGNAELFVKMFTRFAQNYSDAGKTVMNYLEEERFDDIMVLSHSIKSAAGSLGLMKLRDVAQSLEKASLEKDTDMCGSLALDFSEEVSFVSNKTEGLQLSLNSNSLNSDTENNQKDVVLSHLKDLLYFAKKNRPKDVNEMLNTKLKGFSCKGFDLEKRDELRFIASRYNFSKMVPIIKETIKEVENG